MRKVNQPTDRNNLGNTCKSTVLSAYLRADYTFKRRFYFTLRVVRLEPLEVALKVHF